MTPARVATDYEFHQKALIPTEIPIYNPVYISTETLGFSKFNRLMHQNGYCSNLISRMELKSRLSQYSQIKLFLIRPTITDKKDTKTGEKIPSPMRMLQENSRLLEKFIRIIIQIQLEAGLNPITIPFVELPFHEYSSMVKDIKKSLEHLNKESVFFVDMSHQGFENVLNFLTTELQSNFVGLYFKPYRSANLSYEALRTYVDKDVAFFATNVTRSDMNNISTMHYLPFFGNDIYAIQRPLGFAKTKKDSQGNIVRVPFDYSINRINLFDKESLCLTPITQSESLMQRFSEEYKNDSFIPTILDNYYNANGIKDNYQILNAFSKVSELKDSSSEFSNFQKYVDQNSVKDYIDEKVILKETLQQVKKRTV